VSCWLTIPSARPPEEAEKVLKLWRAQGYRIALWRDDGLLEGKHAGAFGEYPYQLVMSGPYPGYSRAVNTLIAEVELQDPDAEWFVIGGDDVEPDPSHSAEEIARETFNYFDGRAAEKYFRGPGPGAPPHGEGLAGTFGVMQPTADAFADRSIEKIAGSAWVGREFCRRMYGGNGPLFSEYTRFFMDQELQEVAIKYGVFQQRPDLLHFHRWYGRASDDLHSETKPAELPEHLKHQEKMWQPEKQLFYRRQRAGFPGSEPIA
jgi:hypothetical protein